MIRAGPRVEVSDFRRAIQNLCQKWHAPQPRKLGLAISGGIDSMALASLAARAKHQGFFYDIKAFIVDHKLRPTSTQEVAMVKTMLDKLGIESEILTADVAADPSHLESSARTIRYRLLGQACYRSGIRALLTAHHSDDQAETVMWRLANNYGKAGLRGMHDINRIPECEDLYGASASGQPRRLKPESIWRTKRGVSRQIPLEGGGVDVFRPFLPFTKAQLTRTCIDAGVEWIEDETNSDASIAGRNAIRQLLASDLLPQALRKQRLLQISAFKTRQEDDVEQVVQKIIADIDIKVDFMYGRIVCKIPVGMASAIRARKNDLELRTALLRSLINMVTPRQQTDKEVIAAVALQFLAEQPTSELINSSGQVRLRLVSHDRKAYTYELSRANPERRTSSAMGPFETIETDGEIRWTQWQLWDKRYWIRLGHRLDVPGLPADTTICFYSKEMRDALSAPQRRLISIHSKSVEVQEYYRFSIPVICNAAGKPVVAPSIGISWDNSWELYDNFSLKKPQVKYFYDIHFRG